MFLFSAMWHNRHQDPRHSPVHTLAFSAALDGSPALSPDTHTTQTHDTHTTQTHTCLSQIVAQSDRLTWVLQRARRRTMSASWQSSNLSKMTTCALVVYSTAAHIHGQQQMKSTSLTRLRIDQNTPSTSIPSLSILPSIRQPFALAAAASREHDAAPSVSTSQHAAAAAQPARRTAVVAPNSRKYCMLV